MSFFILAFLSTLVGAIVGVGGGMIIRPMLNFWDIAKNTASMTSSVTVLMMAIVTLLTHKARGTKILLGATTLLAAGSMLGGVVGSLFISLVSRKFIYISYFFVLLGVLLAVNLRKRMTRMTPRGNLCRFLLGMGTGILSGFFGIGGGPFQMTVLLMFFDMEEKDAAVQSVFITLLTTITSLLGYVLQGNLDFSLVLFTIPGGILGGFVGGILNRKLKNKQIALLFNLAVIFIAGIQALQLFLG